MIGSKLVMRTSILIVSLLIFSSSIHASPSTYIGLYTDDEHSICSAYPAGVFVSFTTLVWVLPSDNGMLCTSYGLSIPEFVLVVGSELNPIAGIPITGCDSPQDCSVCFSECQNDWIWLNRYTMMLTEYLAGYIDIVSPTSGSLVASECIEGNPTVQVVILGYLGINAECLFGPHSAETNSWGVIKHLYSD